MSGHLAEACATVPEWITKVAQWAPAEIRDACEDTADVIAGGSDLLWHDAAPVKRRKTPAGGEPPEPTQADVIEALARALAILAHAPGGVTALGKHWCTAPHADCPGSGTGPGMDEQPAGIGKAQGAYYTPRALAEEVTFNALEACVYAPGPLQTGDRDAWRLKTAEEITSLKVGDITAGAGAFLLATFRYLGDRLMEAWQADGRTGSVTEARRAVVGCVHGCDINPAAIEFAKVTVWLILFDPDLPHPGLDRQMAVGDSLLGITSLHQLAWMHVSSEQGKDLHATDPSLVAFPRYLAACITVTSNHRAACTNAAERAVLRAALDIFNEIAIPIADLVIAAAMAGCGKRTNSPNVRRKAVAEHSLKAAQQTAATWAVPAHLGEPESFPRVYASAHGEETTEWHLADPTTDTTRGEWAGQPWRTWVLCGRLYQPDALVHAKALPADGQLCARCTAAARNCDVLLGIAWAEAADKVAAGAEVTAS